MPKKYGRQTPTQSYVLPYVKKRSNGPDAIALYEKTGRKAQKWQTEQIRNILATGKDGLFVHSKYGYSVPRRNGKNEIIAIRELWGITNGERILHTAHRTTTSHTAWERLCSLLAAAGYEEKEDYTVTKQYGLEKITFSCGGVISFRTRSSKGGLGEGFDLLIIDEAQEYTTDQETALKYVVSDSRNPQTIFCGTPPTPVSAGTVFTKLREEALTGSRKNTGWAEWSVEKLSDVRDKALWYETNPSLGTILTERKIEDEITNDDTDFNIQRLGLWLKYNQHSAISRAEWDALIADKPPELMGKLFAGIKYGHDGANVSLSIAIHTTDGRIFVEAIDCRSVRDGAGWLLDFLSGADVGSVVIDGVYGQQLLADSMAKRKLLKPLLPTVKEIIVANASFEQALQSGKICHADQPSLMQSVSNCEKRAIGNNGGFGYRSIRDDIDVSLLDSVILAHWACSQNRERKKQTISY